SEAKAAQVEGRTSRIVQEVVVPRNLAAGAIVGVWRRKVPRGKQPRDGRPVPRSGDASNQFHTASEVRGGERSASQVGTARIAPSERVSKGRRRSDQGERPDQENQSRDQSSHFILGWTPK